MKGYCPRCGSENFIDDSSIDLETGYTEEYLYCVDCNFNFSDAIMDRGQAEWNQEKS